jgi:hypothetical protein
MKQTFASFVTVLLVAAAASAVTVTGTVKNATTGKPSAGDTVELLSLMQGMNVQATTKSDAGGNFKFDLDDPNTPHIVRVTHNGVNYFPQTGPIRPGMTTVDLDVYDAAAKVDGVAGTVDIIRVQADGGNLQIMRMSVVKNSSNPPRAMNGDKTWEVYLPEGAQVDQAIVEAPGGMPVTTVLTPEGKSGKYYFNYPVKPGETRFQVAYHLPYNGEYNFSPKLASTVQHFVVMMPKSMKFEARNGAKYSPMSDKNSDMQVATNPTPTTNLAFHLSGTGTLQDDQGGGQQASAGPQGGGGMPSGGGMTAPDNRPGGGLGAPIDAPDPMLSYRWVILGGLAVALVAGGVFVVNRSNQIAQEQQEVSAPAEPEPRPASTGGRKKVAASAAPATPSAAAVPPVVAPPATASPANLPRQAPVLSAATPGGNSMLLEGLKEELFQLEIEHQEGRISDQEYESTKSALNQTLKRALQRKS